MQIDDLRRLIAPAEYGQVTDAAATLRISQPTLSRLLARAEDELGTRLFERDAEGVHPNPHGEVVLAAARDITRRYDQLRADLAELLDPGTGTVRLAILPEQLVGASGTTGVPLAAAGAERVIGLTWRTDRRLPPAAARFLTFLRHAAPFD